MHDDMAWMKVDGNQNRINNGILSWHSLYKLSLSFSFLPQFSSPIVPRLFSQSHNKIKRDMAAHTPNNSNINNNHLAGSILRDEYDLINRKIGHLQEAHLLALRAIYPSSEDPTPISERKDIFIQWNNYEVASIWFISQLDLKFVLSMPGRRYQGFGGTEGRHIQRFRHQDCSLACLWLCVQREPPFLFSSGGKAHEIQNKWPPRPFYFFPLGFAQQTYNCN